MTTPPLPDVYTPDDRNPVPDPLTPGVIVPPKDDPTPPDPLAGERVGTPDEERPKQDEDEGTFGE